MELLPGTPESAHGHPGQHRTSSGRSAGFHSRFNFGIKYNVRAASECRTQARGNFRAIDVAIIQREARSTTAS
jgi:hypothetical protein